MFVRTLETSRIQAISPRSISLRILTFRTRPIPTALIVYRQDITIAFTYRQVHDIPCNIQPIHFCYRRNEILGIDTLSQWRSYLIVT